MREVEFTVEKGGQTLSVTIRVSGRDHRPRFCRVDDATVELFWGHSDHRAVSEPIVSRAVIVEVVDAHSVMNIEDAA